MMLTDGVGYEEDVQISYILVENKLNLHLLKSYYSQYDMSELYY
jgi:hypothetical protein